jgi:regulation of enolase protein 1 (concanavalin A-like superfamily)
VWLTEFSPVDWAGTATWTEQDNYRFLAEFLWQAEDQVWFKRYSLFLFSGTPSVNPWDGNGHRGDAFMPDNYTFTPYGELYAAWDADRTLHPLTPYFIHNCATCFRLTSARNVTGPAATSLRHEDATVQWILTNAPASGHYYIQSLSDGRRLSYTNSALFLAPAGWTGTNLEWTFNGPDGNGYYFIDNPNSQVSLNASGSGGSIGLSTLPFGSPSDNTRFRFVKPYYPSSLAAVTAPTGLSAWPADRSVTLRWSGTAPRFNIYRSTTSGSGYTKINGDIKRNYYTDNTAVNGVTCYYVVTALDSLENESAYSGQTTAAPASGLNLGLVAEYKFENGAQDSSGNGFHGNVYGTVNTVAGKVDSSALNFTGGDNSCVEIPNPLGNDFSISFWMNTAATAGTGQWWAGEGLVDGEVPGSTNDFGVALIGSNVGFGVGNPDFTITATNVVNDGQWHHIVATRTSATGAMQLYVDGGLRATGTGATGTHSTPVSLRIGDLQSGYDYFPGSIDEVRLYNYVVSLATVEQLAGVGSTLVANYNFENNAADGSGFGNLGVTNNNVTFVAGKVGALAAQFDGVSSSVQIPASVANDFSIAYWVKTTATGGSGQWWNGKGLVDGEMPGSVADFGTSLIGTKAAFGVGNPDTTIVSTTSINDGNWHHVAATRVNATGAMKLYVDSSLQASATGPTGTRSAPTGLRIGGILANYAGGYLAGAVDDVRLYNYQLSASQIAALVTPQPLPAPWTNADIGASATPGYANYATATGIWSLGGGGADIGNSADQFQFAYTDFSGSGILQARATSGAISSDGTTNASAKTGIMFRNSLAANAPFVALVHDQSQGVQFLYRDSAGALASQQGTNLVLNPAIWFRLVRSNNTFTAWYATSVSPPTPANWILISAHTTTIATAAFAGVVVCSHDNTKLANATFTGVSVSPPTPPTISTVADQVINENTSTGPLSVTLGDALVTGNNLLLTASSSNTNLIPNTNIILGGSGNTRTVQVTPAAYQSGTAVVSLILNNGQPTANTATNSFQVMVQTTAAGTWRQQYFGTTQDAGIAADSADPAGDGIVNVMKRFFGLNPLVAYSSSALPYPLMAGTNFTLNFTHSLLATDLMWQVQWSPDLLDWLTNSVTDIGVSTNGSTEMRQGSLPAGTADPLFMRVQVTTP